MKKSAKAPVWRPSEVFIPTIRVPQPNGDILIRAGKPVVLEAMVGTSEAARILGMSVSWVETECREGRFTTAHKPGALSKSIWKVSRTEVLARRDANPA